MARQRESRPSPDDWRRLGQERYLLGARLSLRPYVQYRDSWDHDHCSFCGRKFSNSVGDLHDGYVTDDRMHWVCSECFEDFRDEFGWHSNSEIEPGSNGG